MKYVKYIFSVIFIIILISCGNDETEKDTENNKYNYTDEIFTTDSAEDIKKSERFPEISEDSYTEGLAYVKIDDKYAFIDRDKEIVIEAQFEQVLPNGFVDGIAAVKKDGKWGFINKEGEFIIEPKYDWVTIFTKDEKFTQVSLNGKEVYINRAGKQKSELIKEKYTHILNSNFFVKLFAIRLELKISEEFKKTDYYTYESEINHDKEKLFKVNVTVPKEDTIKWDITIDHEITGDREIKTSLVLTFYKDGSIELGVATNNYVITSTKWKKTEKPPFTIIKDNDFLKSIYFEKDWVSKVENKNISIEHVKIFKNNFIRITEEGDGIPEYEAEKYRKILTENKLKVYEPVKDDFKRAYVLKVLNTNLIEVRLYSKRVFINLIGIKASTKYNFDDTRSDRILYMENLILYKDIYLEFDDIYNKPLPFKNGWRSAYVWVDVPDIINEKTIKNEMLNIKLIEKDITSADDFDYKFKYKDYFKHILDIY